MDIIILEDAHSLTPRGVSRKFDAIIAINCKECGPRVWEMEVQSTYIT